MTKSVKLFFIIEGYTEKCLIENLMSRYFATKQISNTDHRTYHDAIQDKYEQNISYSGLSGFWNYVYLGESEQYNGGGLTGNIIDKIVDGLSDTEWKFSISIVDLLDLSKLGDFKTEYNKQHKAMNNSHNIALALEKFFKVQVIQNISNPIEYSPYVSVYKTDALLLAELEQCCQSLGITKKQQLSLSQSIESSATAPENIRDKPTWKKIDKILGSYKPFESFFEECDFEVIAKKCPHFKMLIDIITDCLQQLLR